MIAAQMGDTHYRGRIIWMLLTARPDLLPIDLKRQGRAEVHIPLFYPTDDGEIRQMFVILARSSDRASAPEDIPPIPQRGNLSGADIEGMVGRAWRNVAARAAPITSRARRWPRWWRSSCRRRRASSASCRRSRPSSSAPTVSSCRRRFSRDVAKEGGRANLQTRLTALKQIVKEL